jgi:Conjugative transposon protein TcpC
VSGPVGVEARSLRALRLRARLPRALATAAVALLALVGLRELADGTPPVPAGQRVVAGGDEAVAAFAESFARAYLSFDPARPELREARLAGYLSRALDPDAGVARPPNEVRGVGWTAVVDRVQRGPRTTVTVAAEVAGETVHLAVPVERDERGFLAVAGYPALVGPPAHDAGIAPAGEDEVEDPALRAVCERAVRNYLAGARRNLAADLTDDAVVSLPGRELDVRSVDAATWALPGRRVAIQLQAADDQDATWTLRYELAVVRRDRWYVRSLHTDPRAEGGTR